MEDEPEFFYRITEGIRITARPHYAPYHSTPEQGQFVFVYRIRMENVGSEPAKLLRRRWFIHDPVAGDNEVEGEGVVGEQPVLAPGEVYEYESYCVLRSQRGAMEGYYSFARPGGTLFRAEIPRFELRVRMA